jgi:DNA-binding NtrC family response regulator
MTQATSTFRKPVPPSVLVLEESPFWSAELSRQFVDDPISIRMRSHARDVMPLLNTRTISLLLIGLEIYFPEALRLLAQVRQQSQNVNTIVLLPHENLDLEWTLREMGAAEVLPTPVSPERLTDIVKRYLFHKTTKVTASHSQNSE